MSVARTLTLSSAPVLDSAFVNIKAMAAELKLSDAPQQRKNLRELLSGANTPAPSRPKMRG